MKSAIMCRHNNFLPGNIKCEESEGELKFVRSWFGGTSFIFLIFCIICNSGLVMAFTSREESFHILFYFLAALAGISLVYITLAFFLNKTIIIFGEDFFSITHRPLPWYGNLKANISEVELIFSCEHKVVRSSNKIPVPPGSNCSVDFLLKNGNSGKIFFDLKKPEEALFIERKIKKHLLENTE